MKAQNCKSALVFGDLYISQLYIELSDDLQTESPLPGYGVGRYNKYRGTLFVILTAVEHSLPFHDFSMCFRMYALF